MANGSTTVDEIWELIRETRADMRASQKEAAEQRQKEAAERKREAAERKREAAERKREAAERKREFDREMKERHAIHEKEMEELRTSQKETEKLVKETAKQLRQTDSRFNTQWGRLVESLVEGSLVSLLQARGIEVHQTSTNAKAQFVDDGGELRRKEFDILAVNGAEVVAVEVKTTLTPGKVRYFVSAMEDFKRYFPYFGDKTVYGAMAYLRNDSEAALYAERQGLLVVRATGDGASIVNAPDFAPKAFPSREAKESAELR